LPYELNSPEQANSLRFGANLLFKVMQVISYFGHKGMFYI